MRFGAGSGRSNSDQEVFGTAGQNSLTCRVSANAGRRGGSIEIFAQVAVHRPAISVGLAGGEFRRISDG
jgi:hypothetical protein